jgi:hypothetical protein
MSRQITGFHLWRILAVLAVTFVGCQPANPLGRLAVSGNVTLDGQPIDSGTIEFAPESGVGSGAKILNGAYSIETAKGLPPGKYRVRIFAPKLPPGAKPVDPTAPPGPPGPESNFLGVERVSAKFNSATTLAVEVPATTDPQVFDFAVTSK